MLKFLELFLKELKYEPLHVLNASNTEFTEILIRKDQFKSICSFFIDNKILLGDKLGEETKVKLSNLFYNNIWFEDGTKVTEEKIQEFIETYYPANTPEDKIIRLLNYIRSLTKYDGEKLVISESNLYKTEKVRSLYMYNAREMAFYVNSLFESGLIKYNIQELTFFDLHLTTAGLNKIIANDEQKKSKQCFIAMSFDSSLRSVYDNAILQAVKESGFDPVRIDDDNQIPNELTINDAILAGIKMSKFIIADFTQHKRGVYFEAGYALGRGLKVIYTCHEDQIGEAHFDTRNYPHVIWKDEIDLKKKLIDKIEVFIKA